MTTELIIKEEILLSTTNNLFYYKTPYSTTIDDNKFNCVSIVCSELNLERVNDKIINLLLEKYRDNLVLESTVEISETEFKTLNKLLTKIDKSENLN